MVTEELKNAANGGNVLAIVKCIKGYNESSTTWVEEFEDEDTHEIVPVDRCETHVLIPSDEEFDHIDALVQILLNNFKNYVTSDLYLIVNNLHSYIVTTPYLMELVDRGETRAMCLLGDDYRFGDEENGIYKDSARALELFEQAAAKGDEEAKESIEQMNSADDDDEPDVNDVEYIVSGTETSLAPVKKMLDLVNEQIGYKDSPVGSLYLPYSALMQLLVGSTEYTGNVLKYAMSDGKLVITAECETHSINAFMYALYDCFSDIEVTVKEG